MEQIIWKTQAYTGGYYANGSPRKRLEGCELDSFGSG
jgi:hypothetical protein